METYYPGPLLKQEGNRGWKDRLTIRKFACCRFFQRIALTEVRELRRDVRTVSVV